jgi:hypothetical protein
MDGSHSRFRGDVDYIVCSEKLRQPRRRLGGRNCRAIRGHLHAYQKVGARGEQVALVTAVDRL